jgi:hypothetical protein
MIIRVPLEKIHPNPYQPESRLNVPEEEAERFGRSILEHGLLQIPVARLGVPLVLKADYKGEVRKYLDPSRPRGDFSRIAVKSGKLEFVIVEPMTTFKDPNAERLWREKYPELAREEAPLGSS